MSNPVTVEKLETMIEDKDEEIGSAVWDCPDVATACMCHLDLRTLCSASAVSTKWHALASSDDVWRDRMGALCGPDVPLSLPAQRRSDSTGLWKRLLLATWQLQSSWACLNEVPAEGAAWSSQGGDCSIDWTLCDDYFWSSEPSVDPAREEFLTFRLSQPLCVVTGVEILPAALRRVYAPRQLQVDVGFEENQFHYSSQTESVENEPSPHRLLLPPRGLVVGDHVRVRLKGMHEALAESSDAIGGPELFCTAIRRVRIMGLPIGLVSDNLLAEALVSHALQNRLFRAAVTRELRPPMGEELQVDEIVAGFRAQFGIKTPLWHIVDDDSLLRSTNRTETWRASPVPRGQHLPRVRLGRA